MADYLDSVVPQIDAAVDEHLSETAVYTAPGGMVIPDLRGPFDRDIFTDDAGSARATVLRSTFSVRTGLVPDDPRGGTLDVHGESFDVVDYDDPKDGRVILMLEKP